MKRIEIIVSSALEEEISLEIMQGIYGALLAHDYNGIAVNMETVPDVKTRRGGRDLAQELRIPEFKVPDFLRQQGYSMELLEGRR